MLPPVRAMLSSFVDYQAQPQQTVLRQRISVGEVSANTESISSAASASGRLDILSLSAQLQLSQGFSVFAETIGKLIKLPRQGGEALLEYARRLLDAVNIMSPSERAALERTLNNLLKGVSLRLLTEILKNPSGPDAARMAMRLETAQLLDRDLAAKAAVSSYRQNSGAEQQLANSQPPRAANTAFTATAVPQQNATTGTSPEATAMPRPQANNAAMPAEASRRGDASAAATATTTAGHEADNPPGQSTATLIKSAASPSLPETRTTVVGAEPMVEHGGAPPVDSDGDAKVLLGKTVGTSPEARDQAPQTAQQAKPLAGTDQEVRRTIEAERRMPPVILYDESGVTRLPLDDFGPALPGTAAEKNTGGKPAMTEWLAQIFDEKVQDLPVAQPPPPRPEPEQHSLEDLLDNDLPAKSLLAATEQATEAIRRQTGQHAMSEPEDQPSPGRNTNGSQHATHSAGSPSAPAELAEQLALPMILPHVLREGVPLPHVPYPPQDRQRDPEERRTRPISAMDDEAEQQQSSNGHDFHGEDSAEDQEEERTEPVSDEDMQEADRANDFYWRMAGWK